MGESADGGAQARSVGDAGGSRMFCSGGGHRAGARGAAACRERERTFLLFCPQVPIFHTHIHTHIYTVFAKDLILCLVVLEIVRK